MERQKTFEFFCERVNGVGSLRLKMLRPTSILNIKVDKNLEGDIKVDTQVGNEGFCRP